MPDRLVWAEIDLSALENNVRELKSLLPGDTGFCAVVKADGYGHGALPVAVAALKAGADRLAVATADEALDLREGGMTVPILVMGAISTSQIPDIIAKGITPTLYSPESARAFSGAACGANTVLTVHVQVDTGMARFGFAPEEAGSAIYEASRLPGLRMEGIYSHFATADEADPSFMKFQLSRFRDIIAGLKKAGLGFPLRHIANSAATIRYPETHLDMVRPGIALYGLWPSPDTERNISLAPVMSLKTRIVQMRRIKAGTTVSYGRIWQAKRDSTIGTIPVGYADGWSRLLAGKSDVMIGSRRAPLIGRVCMDFTMVDLSDCPGVSTDDEVLLFGGQDIGADEVAARTGTINYETVCSVGKRVPRICKYQNEKGEGT